MNKKLNQLKGKLSQFKTGFYLFKMSFTYWVKLINPNEKTYLNFLWILLTLHPELKNKNHE